MESIRQYFKRTDKVYLLLCIFSSTMAVVALASWAAKQGNGFAVDEVTGAITGIGDYRRALVQAGADGIVTGVLTPEGELDVDALCPIYAAARAAAKAAGRPIVCTLHRAFDVCKKPFAALEAAKALSLGTILTSGQAASAPAGASLLRRLVEAAGPDLEILVGAGVTPANLPALAAETGAHAFHMSGKQVLDSRMTFRREGVPMGLPGFSEFEVWQTSEETIRAARRVLNEL